MSISFDPLTKLVSIVSDSSDLFSNKPNRYKMCNGSETKIPLEDCLDVFKEGYRLIINNEVTYV